MFEKKGVNMVPTVRSVNAGDQLCPNFSFLSRLPSIPWVECPASEDSVNPPPGRGHEHNYVNYVTVLVHFFA